MDKSGILKLANLARIELRDEDAEKLSHEFGKILGYVSEVKGAVKSVTSKNQDKSDFNLRNVLRRDEEAHESGIYTEKLLANAPDKDKGYIKVKKIL